MASQAQVFANTENAQSSTGPITASGKSIAKLNALRHGLTAQTLVFSPEEEVAYAEFFSALMAVSEAVGPVEIHLAEELIVTSWRLKRVPVLEANLIAQAKLEPAPPHLAEIEDPYVRAALLESTALIIYEKQLRNLHLQEQRLHRHEKLLTSQLAALQTARQNGILDATPPPAENDPPPLTRAAGASSTNEPAPEPIGFVFANPQSNPDPAADPFETYTRNIENAARERDQLRQRYYSEARNAGSPQHAQSNL